MPSSPLTRSSETPTPTPGIGRELGIPSRSPVCSRKSPLPSRTRASFGNRRIASRALGWMTIGRTIRMYHIWDSLKTRAALLGMPLRLLPTSRQAARQDGIEATGPSICAKGVCQYQSDAIGSGARFHAISRSASHKDLRVGAGTGSRQDIWGVSGHFPRSPRNGCRSRRSRHCVRRSAYGMRAARCMDGCGEPMSLVERPGRPGNPRCVESEPQSAEGGYQRARINTRLPGWLKASVALRVTAR